MAGRAEATPAALALAHLDEAGHAARIVRTRLLDLEERLSAAYLGLWRAALAWTEADGPFPTYARRRAIWQVRDEVRAERRRRARLEPTPHDPAVEGGLRAVEARDEAAAVLAALDSLPALQRRVMRLRMDGHKLREIARIEGISLAAAKQASKRALAKLRAPIPA